MTRKLCYYTGVGSRTITEDEKALLIAIGFKLAKKGYILRSGGAKGSDSAFQTGVLSYCATLPLDDFTSRAYIYTPWVGFLNGLPSIDLIKYKVPVFTEKHKQLVTEIHPAPGSLTLSTLKLHMRNLNQVMGDNLDSPSKFLICCSDPSNDGLVSGGTRTAVVYAKMNNIPVYNLRVEEDKQKILHFLEK